jgi:hypothetical protein
MNICRMKSFVMALTAAAILVLGLAGLCSGSTTAPVTKTCAELNGTVIPAASIGLPTTGAMVTSTEVVPAARE